MSQAMHWLLDAAPVYVSLGAEGRAAVSATVPFLADGVLHCANYRHSVIASNRGRAVIKAAREGLQGVLEVRPTFARRDRHRHEC